MFPMPRHPKPSIALLSLLLICQPGCAPRKTGEEQTDSQQRRAIFTDELSIQHGQELFNQYCAACHNFETAEIGPNLSGVTSEESKEWLVSFIQNAPHMIESGDHKAVRLFNTYKQYMPAFPTLKPEDIEHLLAFIHRFSEGQKKSRKYRPGALLNPLPERVLAGDLTLVLEKMLTLPASAEVPPLARINKLLAMETGQGERLFIHDLRGRLYEITNNIPRTYLDVAQEIPPFIHLPGYGTGMGSFAFHPDFEHNGLLYTTHNESAGSAPADFAYDDPARVDLQWVLVEWKTADSRAGAFSGTRRELLRANMYSPVHGFQELTFNPLAKPGGKDYGMLYLGVGDGGAGITHPHLCHDTGRIWGTVVRIDPAGSNSKNGRYGIPADNPFVQRPDALGEVWAYGFRNPHRITWDLTGSEKMFITNIGQHSIEEVNIGMPGADYGWPEREGTFVFDAEANTEVVYPLPREDPESFVYPVAQYDHDDGNAISGGFVYAGDDIPLLRDKYIFGDIPRGKVFYAKVSEMEKGRQAPVYEVGVEVAGRKTDLKSLAQNNRVDLRFGQDSKGDLFIFTKADGALWKVVDAKRSDGSTPAE
ncbi:MAG TPA: PQQ-dependent sugar dehydrogenase [Opitutaceae bacterium]